MSGGTTLCTSRANHQPNLSRDEERDLAQDSCPNSRQAIRAEPYRNANDGEDPTCIHPVTGKHRYRNEDKPSNGRVLWNLFERTVNVTEYRNREDEVNPAKYRPNGGATNHLVPFP